MISVSEPFHSFSPVPLSILAIIPNDGTFFKSSSSVAVPVAFRRKILTCVASGWPPPIAEWLKDGIMTSADSSDQFISESTHFKDSPFVSAVLKFRNRFDLSDGGKFTCSVRARNTDPTKYKHVWLEASSIPEAVAWLPGTGEACIVNSTSAHFLVELLDTNCFAWDGGTKELIKDEFTSVLQGAVIAYCPDCLVRIVVSEIVCSYAVEDAADIKGYVTAKMVGQTGAAFCALKRWQLSGPSVILQDSVYFIGGYYY